MKYWVPPPKKGYRIGSIKPQIRWLNLTFEEGSPSLVPVPSLRSHLLGSPQNIKPGLKLISAQHASPLVFKIYATDEYSLPLKTVGDSWIKLYFRRTPIRHLRTTGGRQRRKVPLVMRRQFRLLHLLQFWTKKWSLPPLQISCCEV